MIRAEYDINVINLRLFYHEDQEGHEGVITENYGRTTFHAFHVLHGKLMTLDQFIVRFNDLF